MANQYDAIDNYYVTIFISGFDSILWQSGNTQIYGSGAKFSGPGGEIWGYTTIQQECVHVKIKIILNLTFNYWNTYILRLG